MRYREFLSRLPSYRKKAGEIVEFVEAKYRMGLTPKDLFAEHSFGFKSEVWQAFCQNTHKLLGIKRKSGGPYALHPTRMALVAKDFALDDKQSSFTQELCLFHDYLEEGDGRNPEGVAKFRSEFSSPHGLKAAVFLSEPMIPFVDFDGSKRSLDAVAYCCHVAMAMPKLNNSYLEVSLLDKLDNLHDLDYITENNNASEKDKREHLTMRLGYARLLLTLLETKAAGLHAYGLLDEGVVAQAKKLRIDTSEVLEEASRLGGLKELYGALMEDRIHKYHKELDVRL